MKITPININCQTRSFKGEGKKNYENPIDRKTERNLAILKSAGGSIIAGSVAMGISRCLDAVKDSGHKNAVSVLVGAAVAAIGMALTLPSALYSTKVSSFTREKEMDVYSRDKDLKSNILEDVNEQVMDKDVSLQEKLDSYSQYQMATNGKMLNVRAQ